jgi:hypothetical protein
MAWSTERKRVTSEGREEDEEPVYFNVCNSGGFVCFSGLFRRGYKGKKGKEEVPSLGLKKTWLVLPVQLLKRTCGCDDPYHHACHCPTFLLSFFSALLLRQA